MKVCRVFLAILFLVTVTAASACKVEDPAVLVSEEARKWTTDYGNVDGIVAPQMAWLVFETIPGLSYPSHQRMLHEQFREVTWSYSTPYVEASGNYRIIMTAQATVNLSGYEIEKTYLVSVDWVMLYNPFEKRVYAIYMDKSTLKLSEG